MCLTGWTGIPLHEAELAAQIWKNGQKKDQEKFWTMREIGDSGTDTAGLMTESLKGKFAGMIFSKAQGNGLIACKGSGVSTS